MMMGMHPPPSAGEEPGAKKIKTDADNLIPESMFIQGHPGPVTFKVQMPKVPDKPELNLNGQVITVTLPITDHVSVLKAKVTAEINMPGSKQKLQIGSLFLKDSNSLGFYNITSNTVVSLTMKERGGRKK
jgi:splicing factor 3A subunit 1